ncbi:hypothetical protein IEO21_01894 [Rhodonia placenta]|uniref:Uncharacterized protein n=1 Tax=Rhodonia placenta TaxID=104341 RepID=A0A8H7U4Y5_9APHY|nr:hypothetical protein IEO21_01894 [Postia placenta]
MGRQLRSRASRPNYATLIHFDDDGAGPSNASAPIFEEGDSGSDFAPEDAQEHAAEEGDEMDDDVVEEDEDAPGDGGRLSDSDIEGSVVVLSTPGPQRKKTNAKVKNVSGVPGIVTSSRQNYVLPSLHHRHRAIPLYDRGGPVERLLQPPAPFRPATVSLTNNWSFTPISDRVGKSWGHNVGPGPLWELMEDRGWFKESMTTDGEVSADERCRRPRVHAGVTVQGCRILTPEDAMPYLPTGLDAQENGEYKAPPPVPCSFGPYEKQTRVMMKMFEARRIEEFIPESKSHVFNPGAPVWGLSWCPIHPDDRPRHGHKQYLAVAPFPSSEYSPSIGVRIQRPASACIQIWSLGPSHDAMEVDGNGGNDPGEMRCELVLCVESGPAFELRWCPLPANDPAPADGSNSIPRKLGILAGTFEDGSFSLYAVPDPASLAASLGDNHDPSQPIFVSMTQPLLRIEFEETMCWGFDWANSEVIAVGCTNGSIAVYDIGEVLRTGQCDARHILPTHHFTVHQSAVRVLAWARTPVSSGSGERTADNPTIIASGGYDGLECLTDIREVSGSLLNRTRDVVNALCYSTYCGGPVTVDNENMIKTYSLSPSMLGRGHTIVEPEGPSWSVAASDYQPQLAIGVADGSCLTTNTLRATRRGGSVPFLVHKIYQLDYSRKDREWRMLEKFLPQEILDRTAATKANVDIPTGIGVWPREVAVQRVVWNDGNGLAGAPFLASATGSGLCRVDWLLGRWHRDRVPYYGVEGIRGEVGVQIDEAEESD